MWTPLFDDAHYGIMPLVSGTLTGDVRSRLLVAIPLGTIIAHLSFRICDRHQACARTVKPILELLGAVPTVVYGYFALTHGDPVPAEVHARTCPASIMLSSAGLVIGRHDRAVRSLGQSEDAMRAVPMATCVKVPMRWGRPSCRLRCARRRDPGVRLSGIACCLYPWNFACHRRNDGGRHRGRHAADAHVQSDRAGARRSPSYIVQVSTRRPAARQRSATRASLRRASYPDAHDAWCSTSLGFIG